MPDQSTYVPHPILLPAVLQAEGEAPCFGTISNLTEQGLAFSFLTAPLAQKSVGLIAKLDFDLMGLHHSCKGLIIHIQDKRALLSLRETSTNVQAALQSINQNSMPTLAARLSTQQTQQACHAYFMDAMKAVVDTFYLLLPAEVQKGLEQKKSLEGLADLTRLPNMLNQLRPHLIRHYTIAYPMYPEQLEIPLHASPGPQTDPADMERVDEWIRRTTIAQQVVKALDPLPGTFSGHYSSLLNNAHKQTNHPYQPDAVLQLLANLITPLRLSPDARALCYSVMGQAFQNHAPTLYEDMLRIIKETPSGFTQQAHHDLSLEQWLDRKSVV